MSETAIKEVNVAGKDLKDVFLAGAKGASRFDPKDADAAFQASTEWADKHDLEPTVGNVYTLVCRAVLMTVMGPDEFNRVLDDEESAKEILEKTGPMIMERMGVSFEELDDAVKTSDGKTEDESTTE